MNHKTMQSIQSRRSIHLIDIENLCGSSNPSVEDVVRVRAAYLKLVNPGQFDQFYLRVSSKHNLAAASFGWPNARVHCKEGHDGADILIAKEMVENKFEKSFSTIYLASGDGGLAPFAKHVVGRGANVSVISLPDSLSMQMRFTGAKVLYLNPSERMVP
jgi:hypothetical protein